ncbi:hypothetical protein D6C92_02823 [Aureobasidium pullulans]|nr:hypothetical protein D6C92_02823 [Aureobasidium pullulans]
MAFGIIEPTTNRRPQGTCSTQDDTEMAVTNEGTAARGPLQHRLDWSFMRRELAFVTIVFGCCATGVIGPVLVPGFSIVAADLRISLTQVTLLNGSLVMALGVSAYVCNALATMCGDRLIFLATTTILIASCCWAAASESYSSLLASRVVQGLGMGSWFALAGTTCINNLFTIAERGQRVGLWNLAIIVSVNIAPIISGRVIVSLSWKWSFWLLAITFGAVLLSSFFLLPETSYRPIESTIREVPDPQGGASPEEAAPRQDKPSSMKGSKRTELILVDMENGTAHESLPVWKRFLGLKSPIGSFSIALKSLVAPFMILVHPAVIWGALMWSVTFTWVIIQGAVADQIWEAPPYNLSPTAVGNLVGISPLIGSALGCLIGGFLCDRIDQMMSRMNGGVHEPEFRLPIMILSAVAMVVGAFGLGEAINGGSGAVTTAVFLAMINFAVGVGCTSIVAYTNEACLHRAGEAFGIAMVVKSAFAFGLTFMLNDFYAQKGPRVFFFTWGALTIGVTMLTIPMYIFGKKSRACDRQCIYNIDGRTTKKRKQYDDQHIRDLEDQVLVLKQYIRQLKGDESESGDETTGQEVIEVDDRNQERKEEAEGLTQEVHQDEDYRHQDAIQDLSQLFWALDVSDSGETQFRGPSGNSCFPTSEAPKLQSQSDMKIASEDDVHVLMQQYHDVYLDLFIRHINPFHLFLDENLLLGNMVGPHTNLPAQLLCASVLSAGAMYAADASAMGVAKTVMAFAQSVVLKCCREFPSTTVLRAVSILSWVELGLNNDNMGWMYNHMAMSLVSHLGLHVIALPQLRTKGPL